MVKLCDLPETVRKGFVKEVSWIMAHRYYIDADSIDEFWGTVEIGIQARRKTW